VVTGNTQHSEERKLYEVKRRREKRRGERRREGTKGDYEYGDKIEERERGNRGKKG
jgi:hypothetical protein